MTRWVNTYIEEHIKEKINLDIEFEGNNFKTFIETFFFWINVVKKQINELIKFV